MSYLETGSVWTVHDRLVKLWVQGFCMSTSWLDGGIKNDLFCLLESCSNDKLRPLFLEKLNEQLRVDFLLRLSSLCI